MMMLGGAGTQQIASMIEVKLSQVFQAQLGYVDGNKNHPFLEEVVSIYASFFESVQSYSNALLMWSKLLRIQQEMFGEDRIQMVSTYKKMASLSLSIGQPQSSIKYYKIIENLNQTEGPSAEELDEETKKSQLEEKAQLYF